MQKHMFEGFNDEMEKIALLGLVKGGLRVAKAIAKPVFGVVKKNKMNTAIAGMGVSGAVSKTTSALPKFSRVP